MLDDLLALIIAIVVLWATCLARKVRASWKITVNGQKLQVVDKFTYLGSTLSRAVHIDDEVTARTAKASVAFGRLRTNVWERNRIRLDTKLSLQGCCTAYPLICM